MESAAEIIGQIIASFLLSLLVIGVPALKRLGTLSHKGEQDTTVIESQATTIAGLTLGQEKFKERISNLEDSLKELKEEAVRDKAHIDSLLSQVEEMGTLRERITALETRITSLTAENGELKIERDELRVRYDERSEMLERILSKLEERLDSKDD